MEDGVEVVVNHLEPYKLKGVSSSFTLEKELVIDTERDEVAAIGLTDINVFDIDSERNIYFIRYNSNDDFIYKFDKQGKFITSFARNGQGPGEIGLGFYLEINNQEQLVITDYRQRKIIFYDEDGHFINELALKLYPWSTHPLSNGKYLLWHQIVGVTNEYLYQTSFALCDSNLKVLVELNIYKFPNFRVTKKRKGTVPLFARAVARSNIFIGNENRGYEIWVFDLEGNLLRKIRKDYNKVKIPELYKQERLENVSERSKTFTYFPEFFPPYQAFFVDDDERLYVMTYEKDSETGDYIFDIFTSDGFFIGQIPIEAIHLNGEVIAKMIGNRLFCVSEKESGFKELTVYSVNWE